MCNDGITKKDVLLGININIIIIIIIIIINLLYTSLSFFLFSEDNRELDGDKRSILEKKETDDYKKRFFRPGALIGSKPRMPNHRRYRD